MNRMLPVLLCAACLQDPATVDWGSVESRLQALETENARLSSELDQTRASASQLATDLTAAQGRITALEAAAAAERLTLDERMDALEDAAAGQEIVAASLQSDLAALTSSPPWLYDPANDPTAPAVLRVPTDHPDISTALASLAGRRLMSEVTIEVEAAYCGQTVTSPIRIDHPDGDKLRIASFTPDCTLCFDAVDAAVEIASGRTLGGWSGISLTGSDTSETGLLVGPQAVLHGSAFGVSGFGGDGIRVSHGQATLVDVRATDNGDCGVLATEGAYVTCDNCAAERNVYCGVGATHDGLLSAPWSVLRDNGRGAWASMDGQVLAQGAELSGNLVGALGEWSGLLLLDGARVSENDADGVRITAGASLSFIRSSSTFNEGDGVSISRHSYADLSNTASEYNGAAGVHITTGSFLRATLGANTFGDRGGGVGVPQGGGDPGTLFGGFTLPGTAEVAPEARGNGGPGFVIEGARAELVFAVSGDNGGDGFIVTEGGHLALQDAQSHDNQGAGLAADGSGISVAGRLLSHHNAGEGVRLDDGATLTSRATLVEVHDNSGVGLWLDGARCELPGVSLTDNSAGAVSLWDHAQLDLTDASVTGQIQMTTGSWLSAPFAASALLPSGVSTSEDPLFGTMAYIGP